MTDAESALWEQLRGKKLGFKFRRQHPLGIFVADFYCHELHLVIEVDGDIHLKKEQSDWDDQRTANLNMMQIEVIRFTNEEVLCQIHIVLTSIRAKCLQISTKCL